MRRTKTIIYVHIEGFDRQRDKIECGAPQVSSIDPLIAALYSVVHPGHASGDDGVQCEEGGLLQRRKQEKSIIYCGVVSNMMAAAWGVVDRRHRTSW